MTAANVTATPPAACSNCGSRDVRWKLSGRTVAILFGLLILDLFLLANTPYSASQPNPFGIALALGALVTGLMAFLGLLVFLLAKNHCGACGHAWR